MVGHPSNTLMTFILLHLSLIFFKVQDSLQLHAAFILSYTVSPKIVTTLSRYNSDVHESILIIFGTNVNDKVGNKTIFYFATSPILVLLHYLAK